MDELFKTLNKAGHQAQGPLPGVGLHRRLRAAHLRADARHPRRRLRRSSATRTSPTRRSPAARPTFRVTQVQDTPSDPQIIRTVRGTFTVPCYLDKPLLPARLEVPLHRPRLQHADPDPRQHGGADVHLHHPAQGAGRPAAGLALRPRPVRQPERGDGGQREDDGRRPRLRVLRDRLVGDGPAGRADHGRDPGRPVELRAPARPRAAGDAQLPAARAAGDPPAGPRRRPGLPARRPHRCSTRASCSTTATRRAGSSAAR